MSRPPPAFTTEIPAWTPRITPIDPETASEEQKAALKETPSNLAVSDYVLVLAHDPETLVERTPLFNAIMYGRGGLSRAERELGAAAASVVNECVYCAAVHASRYNQLAKDEEVMRRLFADGAAADLPPRQAALLRFATRLSATPPEIDARDVQNLRGVGLDEAEILDLVLSTALFAWANRLMHTLGEPELALESDSK